MHFVTEICSHILLKVTTNVLQMPIESPQEILHNERSRSCPYKSWWAYYMHKGFYKPAASL
jgi:hypothetical protein